MSRKKYILCIVLAAVLILLSGSPAYADGIGAGADEQAIQALSEKIEGLRQESQSLQRQIDSARDSREQEKANRQAVSRQEELLLQEIAALEEKVALMQASISQQEELVARTKDSMRERQEAHDRRYREYLSSLRQMQLYDEGTLAGVLLGADSLSDFLTLGELFGRVAWQDREQIAGIREQWEQLDRDREAAQQEEERLRLAGLELAGDMEILEQRRAELSATGRQIDARLHDIDLMEREYLADLEANKKLQEQMQAELNAVYERIKWSENPYVGGEMMWPVPGYHDISSHYGPRFQNTNFHSGVDIFGGGISGSNVVAANDGTVVKANWTYVENQGYGIYVMLDHGGGTSTLYAHLSGIAVEEGQQVGKGDVIGYVGSTGWSTGPHLHFEVRVDKQHVPPLPYITSS